MHDVVVGGDWGEVHCGGGAFGWAWADPIGRQALWEGREQIVAACLVGTWRVLLLAWEVVFRGLRVTCQSLRGADSPGSLSGLLYRSVLVFV